jgi:hypothetical protein
LWETGIGELMALGAGILVFINVMGGCYD